MSAVIDQRNHAISVIVLAPSTSNGGLDAKPDIDYTVADEVRE
jgi:hypothetical protein